MEVQPGEELQVDFGTGAKIRSEQGTFRRTHDLRCVLNLHAFEQSISDICENLLANPFITLHTSDIAFDGTLSDFGTWL